jgi:hypothetical protein
MAALDEVRMRFRKANVATHRRVPPVGDRRKMRIQGCAQVGNDVRQRITEIFIFSAAEAMPLHDDPAAENVLRRIQLSQRVAFRRRQQTLDQRVALLIEVFGDLPPIDPRQPLRNGGRFNHHCAFVARVHAFASRASNARLRSTPQR